MFHGHLDYFQKQPLGDRPNKKTGRPWYVLWTFTTIDLSYLLSCVRTRMNRDSLEYHLVEGMVTYDFTLHLRICDHTTWFWRCVRTASAHFLLSFHNFMVTTLGSCVKWPLVSYDILCRCGSFSNDISYEEVHMCHHAWSWLKFGRNPCKLLKQSLVYFVSSQLYTKTMSGLVEIWMKTHTWSENNCHIINL
jgi:hypothetical protein